MLNGKWALVTGSSRGIGQKVAAGLAKKGCNVFVHGRTQQNTIKTMEFLSQYSVDSFAVYGDLATDDGLRAVIDQVLKKVDHVEILYNNAAIMNAWKDVWNISQDEWKEVLNVNLHAVVKLCNVFVPKMLRRAFGRIVNVTSGIKDTPQLTPYSVSKAAIDKYTKDLAAELQGTNILVNCMDPGWLKTDLGGPNADHEVDTVLPGALVPVLLEDFGPSGQLFRAQDYQK